MRAPGLRNFHRVDAGLYRCARLAPRGISEIRKLGVKTVVNLRREETDRELLAGTGIEIVRQPCSAREITLEHLVRFLEVATDPERRPVLVHCWAGADRTGALVAAYRVAVQGWSKEEAVREMRKGGFSHHGWRFPNLARLIVELDVAELRRRVGIEPPCPKKKLKKAA